MEAVKETYKEVYKDMQNKAEQSRIASVFINPLALELDI